MSEAILERDVVCRGCGYNLRSLSADGVCAECGVPVWYSLLPESLWLNEPKHFWMARVGVLLIIAIAGWEFVYKTAAILCRGVLGGLAVLCSVAVLRSGFAEVL